MPHRLLHLLACAGLLAIANAGVRAAGPETYTLDPVHTHVGFMIEHAGFLRAMGAISASFGTLRFDRDDWRSAQVDVTVPFTRLDLGDPKWNAAALAANLLDGKRHPEARFVSRQVEGLDADHAQVCGDLSLRGVTQPLCMEVSFNALKRHPLPPFRRTAGFSATAKLSRKAFGMTAWPSVIGDEVTLLIEAEAIRQRGNGEAMEVPTEPAEAPAEPVPTDANEIQPERESDPPPDPSNGSDAVNLKSSRPSS
jgi:polyisoprenoid-binding protein YceI